MCDSEIPNLIDLSIEGEVQHKPDSETESLKYLSISSTIPSTATDVFNSFQPSAPLFTTERRDSLDNNPFDCAQKLVDRPDDPFELVEKEACYKARHSMMHPTAEVKLANLLSLSDDNILNDLSLPDCASPAYTASEVHSNSTTACTASTIYHSAIANDLDNESPPISMSMKSTPDSGSSVPDSFGHGSVSSTDGSGGLSEKHKKALEYRRRLLKLSIANSTFCSPVSRHMSIQSEASALSVIFAHCGDHMLASESPLKLIDDDEGTSENQRNFVHSEKDFDADLEMLKIPILQELPSPVVDEATSLFKVRSVESSGSSQSNQTSSDNTMPDFAAIRAKLRAKREEATNNQDISALIRNLKSLISNIDAGDDHKKRKANFLLETLSSTLACCSTDKSKQNNLSSPPPQPIVRQSTFDIELQENDHKDTEEQVNVSPVSGEITQCVQSTSPNLEIPDAMIKSSATYDGEGVGERDGLILPVVEPFSSPSAPTPPITPQKIDVNDIIEQLSKLLEQHQLSQVSTQCENTDGSVAAPSHTLNPTIIVVMNAAQTPQHENPDISFCDNSPDSVTANAMRRRSQSLSIHDKVKIVQIPMRPPTPLKPPLKKGTETSIQADTVEFKTPSRMIRRNSFSTGPPYTPRASSNYGPVATTTKRTYGNSDASRRLSTHHEGQHSVSRRPMNFPHNNFNSHKPDLKKKVKSNADSIMKSSLPLKATIPLKKVAPSLRTSPSTPETATGSNTTITHKPSNNSLNSSMRLLAQSLKMSYTSTPMPPLRSTETLSVATEYPNACSTPTGAHHNTTPLKRIGTNKPRYSYNATTPVVKQVASASAVAAGLKRRTLNEFKAKSPIKPRISNTAGADASNGIKSSSKLSMKLQTDVPRTSNRMAASAATSSSRIASSRLSTRASINHNATNNKNKENKYP